MTSSMESGTQNWKINLNNLMVKIRFRLDAQSEIFVKKNNISLLTSYSTHTNANNSNILVLIWEENFHNLFHSIILTINLVKIYTF